MASVRSLRSASRLLSTAACRPASPGKFGLSPRFTGKLQERTFADRPGPANFAPGPAQGPRYQAVKADYPARSDDENYAIDTRGPPQPPMKEQMNLETGKEAPTFLGTTKRLPEFNLADKVVLVSGGARGLGLTQAEALLEAGATVYALDRLPEPSPYFNIVQQRAAETLGAQLHYRQIDVRDAAGLRKTIDDIADTHQRLDGLVAAAGIQQETPALEYNMEDANNMFAVNITGAMMTACCAARNMIKYECAGSIVMIASMSGTIANRGLICSAYNASKAGVIQLGRNLAAEWGQYKIRVNTISPGYIVTDMVEKLFEAQPERRLEWGGQNMLGRVSAPAEYRGAAVFLISEASSFMTGSDLIMDGGHHSW